MKKISIIIPYYNCHQYFEETLESITTQSYKNSEVIIVDDCSEDKSFQRLQELVEQYQAKVEINLLRQKENLGAAAARNIGLENTHGEFLLFLDSDDVLAGKYSLEFRIDFLESHSGFDGTAGYSIRIDSDSKLSKKTPFLNPHFNKAVQHPQELLKEYCLDALERSPDMVKVMFMLAGSCLMKTAAAKEFLFNSDLNPEEDIDWMLQFLSSGKQIQLHKLPFHFRRLHPNQYHLDTPKHKSLEVLEKMKRLLL